MKVDLLVDLMENWSAESLVVVSVDQMAGQMGGYLVARMVAEMVDVWVVL